METKENISPFTILVSTKPFIVLLPNLTHIFYIIPTQTSSTFIYLLFLLSSLLPFILEKSQLRKLRYLVVTLRLSSKRQVVDTFNFFLVILFIVHSSLAFFRANFISKFFLITLFSSIKVFSCMWTFMLKCSEIFH